MLEVKKQLEALGHEVLIPPHQVKNKDGEMIPVEEYYTIRKNLAESGGDDAWIWERKSQAIKWHFDKINQSDCILVLNHDKNEVANYIGGNVFLEMGLACWLKKTIYLLNALPAELSYTEEIKGMMPIVINGDLSLIK